MSTLLRAMAAKGLALFAVAFLGLSGVFLVAGPASAVDGTPVKATDPAAKPTTTSSTPAPAPTPAPTVVRAPAPAPATASADQCRSVGLQTGCTVTAYNDAKAAADQKAAADAKQAAQNANAKAAADAAARAAAARAAQSAPPSSATPVETSESAWPTYTATSAAPMDDPITDTPQGVQNAGLANIQRTSSGPNLMTLLLVMAAVVVVAGGAIAIFLLNRAHAGRH